MPAPTIVLDQQVRNGSFDSASLSIPTAGTVNPDTGQPYIFLLCGSTMSDADALNAANSCLMQIWISWDGSTYVQYEQPINWFGGNLNKQGNPQVPDSNPGIPVDINGNFPQRVYVSLDTVGNSLNMGLTIGFQ